MSKLSKLIHEWRARAVPAAAPGPEPQIGKAGIVHHLAERYGYRRYLEFATATTGLRYVDIDPARFDVCARFLYRCPRDFEDGLAIDWRAPGDGIEPEWSAMLAENRGFDVMLVDPFHTYHQSLRDLQAAFALLPPGGAMVVHDCRPPGKDVLSPEFHPGPWGGVTYKAYVDFVLGRRDLRFVTVDTDWGCGIVRKLPAKSPGLLARFADGKKRALVAEWRALPIDAYDAAWELIVNNERALLNLTSVSDFLAGRHRLG